MNKICKLLTNKGSTIAYATLTALFSIIPEESFKRIVLNSNWTDVKIIIINRLLICLVLIVIFNIGYHCYRKRRKSVSINGVNYVIDIEQGNLFDVNNGIVIIDFDECFTCTLGYAPGDIKPESVCGQYLKLHPINNIKSLIDAAGIKPEKTRSKYKKLEKYAPGTIVPNGRFLLMAFTKLNEDGLGYLSYNEYLECLNTLWREIDKYHGTNDVYMPILGSKITRFDKELTQQDLLDTIIASYRLNSHKLRLPYKLHIVYREREGFSLNDIFGVE